ncbi:MAG: T9SS C-terminal target domain-containing protein [Sphingobacteriales bacterium]|nr:MAG: T9SS C-terminal target domain-containing protein [Sphingobacteriales bacterium]
MKKLISILFTLLVVNNTYGQQLPYVKNSWFGNSSPNVQSFVPQGIEGMCVSKDGTVYSNVPYEEGGGNFGEFKTNGDVTHGDTSFGWGMGGGSDATSNSTYVYWSMEIGNEGGGLVDPQKWPVGNNKWLGVSRRLKSNVKEGAPFPTGKGDPAKSVLIAYEFNHLIDTPSIHGLYATETELFVSIDKRNLVKVYDAETMVFKRSFSAANPYQIAMDSYGNIWIAQGYDATKIKRYSPTGTLLPQSITLPAGSFVGDFCIDKNDRILIGDVGRREQVLIYTNINTSPEFTATFGTLNGIHSGISGRNAPLKFQQIRGIGVDNLGNIYIGNTQWHTGGQGTMVEKYSISTGEMQWKRYCTMFVDASGIDAATDGEDIYSKVEHFKIDYSKPAGQDATYASYTIDRYKYPSDPRLWQPFENVLVRTINGQKFLLMSSMSGEIGAIFRFNPATDGDIAIPCILLGNGVNPKYPGSINNSWMWRDLNANGQMEAGEYTQTDTYFIDGGKGGYMDDNGDIWISGGGNLLHYKCLGLDANNILLYDGNYTTIPTPAPLIELKRVQYDTKLDRMYLAGTTPAYPTVPDWPLMGKTILRYDNWSTGNRVANSELVLDSRGTLVYPISFRVAGDYIFQGFVQGDETISRLQLDVYNTSTNAKIGYIRQPWEFAGYFDMAQCLDAYKRKNGEYIIVTEEDGNNKNVMYRWTPAGNLTETTDKLTANTNYVKFQPSASNQQITVASNIAWVVTGAPTWLKVNTVSGTGNGIISLDAVANSTNTNRSAIITLSGGAVTNQITVFQGFNDLIIPNNVTNLTANLLAPFSFNLNWTASTDNVMVTGYQIFKNGNLVATTSGLNTSFTGLLPNTAYTMLVKAIDAAGNVSTGTNLIVTTLDVTYPNITARGHANFETPQKAFDGINSSTWMDWEGTTWLQIQYAAPVVYNQYSIFSQDDLSRERDPKNWVLQGSNDGVNYTNLSTQNNQMWATQGTAKTFYSNNTTAYSHYRFNFSGSNGLQLGEVIFANGAIIDTQKPTIPLALSASGITESSVLLEWDASSDNVTVSAYEVFKDGNFIATVAEGTSYMVTALTANTNYSFTVRAKDVTGNFSAQSLPLSLQTGFAVLPVTLTSFTGTLTTNGNQLAWATASEKNNNGFEVQRSGDGKTFETLTTIKGAGTTNAKQFYNYLDKTSTLKTSYYRLKQIDFDGKIDYSGVIAIKSNLNNKVVVYPNPFTSEISVSLVEVLKPNTKVAIYDMLGRKQNVEFTINGNIINCKTNNLTIGSYVLKIITDGGIVSKVVIKN